MKVAVGIPTLNGPDRLQRLLTSIDQCTRVFHDTKIVVCDDGSEPENLKLNKDAIHGCARLRQEAGLEMLMNSRRCGIAVSWNGLTRHCGADVTVLINDDIEVVEHWLDVLVYSALNNPAIGMVGLNAYMGVTKGQFDQVNPGVPRHVAFPRIDYHEARLQTGGGRLLSSIGSIFAFRKDAYDAAGGFDERYFCFYEELDLGVTMRTQGRFHAIASYPVVYHMGGATTSVNLNASEHMDRSRRLFIEKWHGRTPTQLRADLGGAAIPPLNEWNTQIANWQ